MGHTGNGSEGHTGNARDGSRVGHVTGHTGNATGNGEQQPAGVSVAEAAASMGLSARAVRARIRRGTLNAWAVPGPRGMEYRVTLEGAEGVTADRSRDPSRVGHVTYEAEPMEPAAPAAWEAERQQLLEQIAWLRSHVDELTRQLDEEKHERRALAARQVLSLPAPVIQAAPAEPAQAMDNGMSMPGAAAPAAGTMGGGPAAQRRPWWRFWG